jgi:hypothetical protein
MTTATHPATEAPTKARRRAAAPTPATTPRKVAGRGYPDRRKPGEVLAGMTPLAWLKRVGTLHAMATCEKASVGYEQFKHVARGRRQFGLDAATRLARASGGGMSFEALAGVKIAADGTVRTKRRIRKPAAEGITTSGVA